MAYILALDQGTSSSRAIVFDETGNIVAMRQKEFPQHYPQPGWVEHAPEDLWQSQVAVMNEVVDMVGGPSRIVAAGITNQRETTLVWDRRTGQPVAPAIVWQDRRTTLYCEQLKALGYENMVREKTGLLLDAYFSASKLKWMLDHIEGLRGKAENGELAFGTVDSWLVWHLTGGKRHVTDVTNASRTLLYNIHELKWDEDLLELFNVPAPMLPEVVDSSGKIGEITALKIPLAGIAGDQQAALFGQQCISPGMVKNTYGTGCFIMMNTGDKAALSRHQLLTTVGWKIGNQVAYALEGSVFIGGATVQWLRDGLGIILKSSDIEALAMKEKDNGGVFFVPALTGLGAPYWDSQVRGMITGITRGTNASHIARATLEAIAYQSYEVIKAMEEDAGMAVCELNVDGGACANDLLMQFQSDILQIPVIRPAVIETTALGAAYLAGLGVGLWHSTADLSTYRRVQKKFLPLRPAKEVEHLIYQWKEAVNRARWRP